MKRSPMPDRAAPLQRAPWSRVPAVRLPRSALGNNGGSRRAVAKPKPRRETGPDARTLRVVAARDGDTCFRCGGVLWGQASCQHRRARGMGGSRRPDTNQPQNLIFLCGSSTSPGGCHSRVESRLPEDAGMGWSVKQSENPLLVPVWHWEKGWIYLDEAGGWSTRPEVAA